MKLLLLVTAVVCWWSTCWGALPQFSWDTLPVFFHSSNRTGPYSKEALKVIAKYSMVTIEKYMGEDVTNVDDEDEMAVTMKVVKVINPKVATYFYMDLTKDRPPMTRMYRQVANNPSFSLRDKHGDIVRDKKNFTIFDLTNDKVQKWWIETCLNATKFSNGDGCFCDGSLEPKEFTPSLSPDKFNSWNEGRLNLTRDAQKALGDDNLLIGKRVFQPYVNAAQIEYFYASNDSINSLLLGVQNGIVVQAHVPIEVPCTSDLTDYLAAFLIGAGERTYFGCGTWYAVSNDSTPFMWHPEYDKPLGEPVTPPTYRGETGVWSREFKSGTKVTFNANTNKGIIQWGS